jgi:hypothetical protein
MNDWLVMQIGLKQNVGIFYSYWRSRTLFRNMLDIFIEI